MVVQMDIYELMKQVNEWVKEILQDNYVGVYFHGSLRLGSFNPNKSDLDFIIVRFLYKGIIIKHNKTEPTYTKTSLFLCEKRRFFMARTEKGVVTTI